MRAPAADRAEICQQQQSELQRPITKTLEPVLLNFYIYCKFYICCKFSAKPIWSKLLSVD
ncbi:hypothetical protein Tco_1127299, partial [Tanacetum coccineum]